MRRLLPDIAFNQGSSHYPVLKGFFCRSLKPQDVSDAYSAEEAANLHQQDVGDYSTKVRSLSSANVLIASHLLTTPA